MTPQLVFRSTARDSSGLVVKASEWYSEGPSQLDSGISLCMSAVVVNIKPLNKIMKMMRGKLVYIKLTVAATLIHMDYNVKFQVLTNC